MVKLLIRTLEHIEHTLYALWLLAWPFSIIKTLSCTLSYQLIAIMARVSCIMSIIDPFMINFAILQTFQIVTFNYGKWRYIYNTAFWNSEETLQLIYLTLFALWLLSWPVSIIQTLSYTLSYQLISIVAGISCIVSNINPHMINFTILWMSQIVTFNFGKLK